MGLLLSKSQFFIRENRSVSRCVHTYPSLAFRKPWMQKEPSKFKLLQIALSLANEQAHSVKARSDAERKPSVHVHACFQDLD